MTGRAKRASTSVSKYEEVESDVDMDEEEKKIFATRTAQGRSFSGLAAPPDKKAKIKQKEKELKQIAAAKEAARLSMFVDMPLDLVSEIFNHLHLRDILGFSRLSKMFRSLLNSQLKGVWTSARLRLGLPLPLGMTEVQLANLCYGTNCYFCDKKTSNPNFATRTRACNKCYKSEIHLRNHGTFIARLPQADTLHLQARLCIPHQRLGGRWDRAAGYRVFAYEGQMMYLEETIEAVSDILHAFNIQSGNLVDQNQGRSARVARRSLGSPAVDSRSSIAAPPNAALNAFVEEKVNWVKQLIKDTDTLHSAFLSSELKERRQIQQESDRLSEIARGRRTAIIAKAVELGYEETHMTWVYYDTLFHSQFAFSEEEFDEKRDRFVARCEKAKKDAIEHERRSAEYERQRQLKAAKIEPASP